MADWEKLHEVGREAAPPPFESLVTEARRRDRRARILVGAAALAAVTTFGLGVALVNDDEDATFQPVKDPTPSISDPSEDRTLPDGVQALPETRPEGQIALDAGRYRVDLDETLAFDVDVPDNTSSHSNGLFLATPDFVLKIEAANGGYGVPSHPCTDHTIDPVGPTVGDLVHALTDMPIYQTTRPRPVELGGADGTYLEAWIPRSYDASQCEGEVIQLPGNNWSAVGGPPPYIGRWWVLDVDGQRVVIQQNCWGCSGEGLRRPARMVRSITFAPAP